MKSYLLSSGVDGEALNVLFNQVENTHVAQRNLGLRGNWKALMNFC